MDSARAYRCPPQAAAAGSVERGVVCDVKGPRRPEDPEAAARRSKRCTACRRRSSRVRRVSVAETPRSEKQREIRGTDVSVAVEVGLASRAPRGKEQREIRGAHRAIAIKIGGTWCLDELDTPEAAAKKVRAAHTRC